MVSFNPPFVSKKVFKRRHRLCRICKEDTYELLDVHRIKWGGAYSNSNCVCLCTICHRKVHANIIKIFGWKDSTAGKMLHIINENGEEDFV